MDDVEGREPDGRDERRGAGSCSVTCSICLDPVSPDSVDRSVATLRCRHQFHLDCIASAFNVKGLMRCPNCGQVEKGRWLYGNGCRGSDGYLMDYDETPFRASSSIISDLEAQARISLPEWPISRSVNYASPAWFAPHHNHSPAVPRAHHLPIFPQNRRRLHLGGGRLGGQSSVNLVEQRSPHQIGYGPRHHHRHLYQHRVRHAEDGSSSAMEGTHLLHPTPDAKWIHQDDLNARLSLSVLKKRSCEPLTIWAGSE